VNWICVATGIMRDPSIIAMAEALGVSVPATTGHVVGVLTSLPEGSDTGDLSAVTDRTLEQWAMWGGKRGKFAAAFRAQLCDAQGVVRSWDKYNGRALRKMKADRDRKRETRDRQRVHRTSDGQSTGHPTDIRETSARRPGLRDETRRDITTSSSNEADVVRGGAADWVPLHFPDPAHQQAVSGYIRAHQFPDALRATLTAIASGQGAPNGQPVPWATIGQAVVEMQSAGARFSASALRGFIGRLCQASADVTWDDIFRSASAPEASHVA